MDYCKQAFMIHYITSGNSNLNLGKEINDFVEMIPDTDWVCLRDIDTMPAYHEKFFSICESIAKSDYDLVGCMTNRLGLKHQLHNGVSSNNTDWNYHRKIGKIRYAEHGNRIEHIQENIAGVFMMFPKRTWLEVCGFLEGGICIKGKFIDWYFSNAVKEKHMKIGIATGLYLIHMYRPDAVNTRHATSHLCKQ